MTHPNSLSRRLALRLILLFCLVLTGWTGLVLAQDPQNPETPLESTPEEQQEEFDVFVDQVNVNVVNVDVYVTDKKGNRITNLTPDNFELTENGRPVAISNFYKVEGGRRLELAPRPDPAEGAGVAEPTFEPIEPELQEAPEDQRLHLVVYIDNWNLRPFNRNRVMGDLRRFLIEKLDRDDRVMLVTYDRSFKVEQPFTSDLRAVARATFDIEKRVAGGINRDSERNQMIQLIDDSQGEFEALSHARSYAQSVENDLTFTIRALKELTESLAGLPGRKAVLYVSDGLPQVAGQDLFLAVDEKFGSASNGAMAAFNFDFHREYTRLAAEANANGVTFYPLDARGLEPPSHNSAEFRGTDIRGAADRHRIPNLQTPLRYLAEETGGFAIVNTNSPFPLLERMADDFSSYYSLGYVPSHYGDGRYYNLKVKVKNPEGRGLVVRHREGYRDLSTETRMTDGTMAALNYNVTDNPLGVKLEFDDEQRRDDGYYLLPVQVRIPIGNVAMIPRENTHEGRVKVYVGALDDRGRSSPVQQMMVPISIPNDEIDFAKTQEYVYTVTLLMRAGSQRVAVGVRDEISAEETFLNRQVLLGNPRRG